MGSKGTTVYPKMFNLDAPFQMGTQYDAAPQEKGALYKRKTRKERLEAKGEDVAKRHSVEYDAMEAGKKVEKLPMTLGEAIDRLDKNEIIKSALPEDMLRVFMHYKKDEWEKFLSAVTQWDVDTYLDILP